MKKKWNLYNISESRGILLGIATLIVAFFHCYSYRFNNISFLIYLRKTGNIGVDIFLLLSAIGLYFSYSKNSNNKEFYKKRVLRIIPSLLIVATIYYLYLGNGFWELIKNVTLLSFYINGKRDFWYFALIIVLYVIYPVLHKIIDSKDFKGLIALLLITIGSTMLIMYTLPGLYKNIEIAITRIPVFLIGIYIGKYVKEKKEIPLYTMILFLVLLFVCNYYMYTNPFKNYICIRYLYCLLSISLIFLISFIHSLKKFDIIDKFLVYMGTYSLEVYLIFEKLSLEVRKLSFVHVHSNFIFYTIMFIITMILSMLLKKLCDKFFIKTKKA